MIQTLENFLRPYDERHPHDRSNQLSLAEFAANKAVKVSTGYSPFYLQAGENPIVPSTFLNEGPGNSDWRVEAV